MSVFRSATIVAAGLLLSAASAFAGPTYTFSASAGVQPANVGTITISQVSATTVDVLVDLQPAYGFVNTGGPHTPFAFTLAGSEAGVSGTFLSPSGGTYRFGMFSLSTADGGATPYGIFGISISSTAGNGSRNAYYGDLEFQVTRATGLSTDEFILNTALGGGSSGPAYFAADLTDGTNTGSQAWEFLSHAPPASVPEPASFVTLGAALAALGVTRFRRRAW